MPEQRCPARRTKAELREGPGAASARRVADRGPRRGGRQRAPRPAGDPATLRRTAEARLKGKPATRQSETNADSKRLQHELQVHQIELELQNEELRRTLLEREVALDRYTIFYDFTPAGYLTLTPDGTILQANLTIANWLQVERTRLLKRRFALFVAADSRFPFANLLTRAFNHEAPVVGEVMLAVKVGPPLTVQLRASLSGDGQECRVVLTDVTERQRAEVTLHEKEQRHQTILRTAMDGFWRVDMNGHLLEVNETYCRMSGYTEPELLAMSISDLEAAETATETATHIKEIRTQSEDRFVSRHRRKDGSSFPVEISVQYKQEQGGFQVAFLRDITERKRTEEALRRSEVFAKCVLNALAAHIAVVDEQGTIVAVNDAWRRFARENGGDPAAYVGTNYLAICQESLQRGPDAPTEATLRGLQAVIRGEREEFSLEYPCHSPEEERWFIVRGTRFPGAGPNYVVLAHANITERKRAERSLFTSSEQLHALAGRLESVREEERTRVAREIHDVLAQELTRLKMDVVWLRRRLAPAASPEKQAALQERLALMTQLTDTAIESVQKIATELRPVVLDSLGLCAAVEWQVREFRARTGITCAATVPEQNVPLDRERSTAMFRILQESLTNVLRHAQATRVTVRLWLEAGQLVLRIQDDGCGIASATLSDPKSIGLVGMRERALLLGGEFEIRTEPELGASVEVRFPLSQPASPLEEGP